MTAPRRAMGVVLVVSIVVPALLALYGSMNARPPAGSTEALDARRVVLFTMPGVTWSDVEAARTPNLDRVVEEGSSAALAPRSASVRPSAVRGYLTLGAGNRAAASNESSVAQEAYLPSERVDGNLTAGEQLSLIAGPHRHGGIVHLGIAELAKRQRSEYHGAEVGALGEALTEAGISTGVVSAGDRAVDANPPETGRGAPVTALMDARGVVTVGEIRGLVVEEVSRPYGVRTDRGRFGRAVEQTLRRSEVLLVDPGETLRADGFASSALPEIAARHKRQALERTDVLLGDVVDELTPTDLLFVLAPSSDSDDRQEHLTALVAWGSGIRPGLLLSATTRRAGVVTLTDVAPSVLAVMGVDRPRSMSGRAMRSLPTTGAERPGLHEDLDARSVFRESFVPSVFYTFVALFVLVSILVGLVFLLRLPLQAPLVGMCYVVLAVPIATFALSVLPLHRAAGVTAHLVLWTIAVVIAGVGWVVAGPRWTGALPLLLATSVFIAVDLLTGGHLLVNAVFGNSVLAAGRFYGIPNTGSALFFGATVLALAGIAEQWRTSRTRVLLAAGLVVLLALTGLPPFGADVGGLLTGFAAAVVILVANRPTKIPWRLVVFGLLAAVAVTLFVAFLDSLRPVAEQTHFGRFGEALFGGDANAMRTILRKASQSWSSLSFSRFTYVVPLGIAALAILLRRPQGPLREVLPAYPIFRAALAGLLVSGVLGFALNDSGVAVPAMLLAQAVPLVVLLGVDHVRSPSGVGDG